jgi:hypothetical protein
MTVRQFGQSRTVGLYRINFLVTGRGWPGNGRVPEIGVRPALHSQGVNLRREAPSISAVLPTACLQVQELLQ